jgi:DNA repair protein RadC
MAPRDQKRAFQNMQELVQTSAVTGTKDFTLVRADGSEYPAQITASVLRDAAGNPIGFISIIRDLTKTNPTGELQLTNLVTKQGRRLTKLQDSYIKKGFKGFEDREIIELLLSLVLPARQAKRLARASIVRFKNLRDFLAASPGDMQQIGINHTCTFCLKLLHELPTEVLKQRIVERSVYESSKEVFDYLYYSMRDLQKEVFKVIYLDNRSQILDAADLFEGARDIIPIRPREIVENAITHGAAGLIFVHNHPSGDPTPSRSDKQLSRDLVFVGMILRIKVLDHIVIGADSYFSFADEGLIQKYEDNFLHLKIKGVLASRPPYRHYSRINKDFAASIR